MHRFGQASKNRSITVSNNSTNNTKLKIPYQVSVHSILLVQLPVFSNEPSQNNGMARPVFMAYFCTSLQASKESSIHFQNFNLECEAVAYGPRHCAPLRMMLQAIKQKISKSARSNLEAIREQMPAKALLNAFRPASREAKAE